MTNLNNDPKETEVDLDNEEIDDDWSEFEEDEEWDDDPAFDHLRDEERNFIAEERERERDGY